MRNNKTLTKKDKEKRIAAIKTIKKVLDMYKKNFKYLSEQKDGIPLKGVSTKALHTILGTKAKQKAKECNHCHETTHNGKSLCNDCAKIPICKVCTIMMGNWGPNEKTGIIELQYDAYNAPSEDPNRCKGCFDAHAEVPIKPENPSKGIGRTRNID